jgi:hypothetical protein
MASMAFRTATDDFNASEHALYASHVFRESNDSCVQTSVGAPGQFLDTATEKRREMT